MAGGKFVEGVDKVRAGLYMNFRAAAAARIGLSERGTVAIPLVLPWGDPKKFLKIEAEGDFMAQLGYDINDPEVVLAREAKRGSKTLLVYRLNSTGEKASVTIAPLTATAKYAGERGNDLKIVSTVDVLDSTKKVVQTLLNGRVVDEQKAANVEDLVANAWIDWSGTGTIPATAGADLVGGTNGTVANQDHTDFLGASETQFFDVIAYPYDDAALKTTFKSFVERMRDEEGKKIQGVVPDMDTDYEGIIQVFNGVELNDGTKLDKIQAVAWTAGVTAGAQFNQSNTYRVYEGAVDAYPRLKNSEIIDAIKAGKWVFMVDGENVRVETDINSLHTYSQDKNKRFSKNKVIRVLDAIANDFYKVVKESYIGKMDNSPDGQSLLKDAGNEYLFDMQDARGITNVDPINDFVIDPVKSVGDEVHAKIGVQPVDSMEKFYFDVVVR